MLADPPPAFRLDLVEVLPVTGPRHRVPDPYRWLEDADSEPSRRWSRAQQDLFAAARSTWPAREGFAARLREVVSAGSVGSPAWRGARRFWLRREVGADHARLLVTGPGVNSTSSTNAGQERVLLDPGALDPTGATTLDAWSPSREGDRLAYQLSSGGDEESVLRVLDVATGEVVDGPIDRVRYSPVAWLPGGDRFYYVRRLAPELLPEGEGAYHRRVWLHTVGADPATDVEVFGAGRPVTSYYGVGLSRDGRWLSVSASVGTSPRTDAWIGDLAAGGADRAGPADGADGANGVPALVPVAVGEDAHTSAGVGRDGRLYVSTDLGAPRGRLAVADPGAPGVEHWRELLPERADAVLEDWSVLDGPELAAPLLLAAWTRHAVGELTVHDLASGALRGQVALPGTGSLGRLASRPEGGHEAWFTWTDTTTPPLVMHLDARTLALDVQARPPGAVVVDADVRARQLVVTSADGTAVRLLVVARADALDAAGDPVRALPTILYGYGGFGHTMVPGFSASALTWVEAGGAWAVAGLRGGCEEGEEWHRAGMLGAKQNVFDDFAACADALVERGWTTPGQLVASGGSNGGLLVGAALAQRPEAFAGVLCSAPLLDMVRYQLHGLGATWAPEYGDAGDAEQLEWLLAYSPYHAVERAGAGRRYPAVLFTVFDGDTRVDPLHARKMAAALQHATADPRRAPVLVRAEGGVGHGARSVSRSVELAADTLGFAAWCAGLLPPVPPAS